MHRRILALVAAGALLAVVTVTVSTQADAAGTGCARTGSYTMCATDPNGAKDTSIISEIVEQVGATGKGDTIRAAVFQWTLDAPVAPLAEAMVAAEKRGVDVRAVLGTRSDKPSANDPVINKLRAAGAKVRQCSGSCLPNADGTRKGPMHNRFFLIERGGSPTVLVTSFSFVRSHTTQSHNLLGVHGDRGLFDFYTSYWNRLYGKNWDGWTDKNKGTTGNLGRAWVLPRGDDAIAAQLAEITKCASGDRVLVAHANFQSNRSAVRSQLDRIQGLGCQVRVVVLDASTSSPRWIEEKLGSGNVRVHGAHRNKYIVAEASFGGRHRAVVWTGTHNLNGNGMKHADDNLLRVANEGVADRYAQHFQRLWNGGR
ncbi:phosphatidylserine/phosphatidylglycerophosphate/cardiolipin synthase family protein [Glycomyces sp. YM15]|uniref:phospholipase D-like domain-containing protein n=1 Tax=Glycomyces sp. YM15 TaxID=2800446 RepID=UPI0019659FD2|nr:phospholipase D-like domain-containing protein [Glycomyces sp. YM15]